MNNPLSPLIFDKDSNFLLVFRLPLQVPNGFCFNGGYPVSFQLVDWFEANAEELTEDQTRDFIRRKPYYVIGLQYLVLRRNGSAFLVDLP